VATRVAVDGLAARDGVDCLIRNDPEGLATATCSMLADDALAARLRAGAVAASSAYGWHSVVAPIEDEWRAMLAVAGADRGAA
jgi:hypothetical protein